MQDCTQKMIDFSCEPVEVCGRDAALHLCFLMASVFWRVGDISGRRPFWRAEFQTRLPLLRLWFSLPQKLQVCVFVQSDTAEVWVCLCQSGSSLTLSLAGIHLLWSLLLHGEPFSWEFNESDGWSADRISQSVDGDISPEINWNWLCLLADFIHENQRYSQPSPPSTLSFFQHCDALNFL